MASWDRFCCWFFFNGGKGRERWDLEQDYGLGIERGGEEFLFRLLQRFSFCPVLAKWTKRRNSEFGNERVNKGRRVNNLFSSFFPP